MEDQVELFWCEGKDYLKLRKKNQNLSKGDRKLSQELIKQKLSAQVEKWIGILEKS